MGQAQSPQQDLSGQQAIETIKKLTEKAGVCFFVTDIGKNPRSIPMALQEVDENGTLWFISSEESTHNKNLSNDPSVQLYFLNNSSYEYVFLQGTAVISKDRALIDKYYTHFADAWFDGKDDPRITLIAVKPDDGYYYETKDNKIFAMAKMLFAAATGAKMEDGGVEGGLNV